MVPKPNETTIQQEDDAQPPEKETHSREEYLWVLKKEKPSFIEIKDTPYGKGIFTTKAFKKGELLYVADYKIVPNCKGKVLVEQENGEDYELDLTTHSVKVSPDSRFLFFFDAFMNHSCDPTSYSAYDPPSERNNYQYKTVAARDILAGEEITCDYDLFEWDCRDKGILNCQCGASQCRKQVIGFKYCKPSFQESHVAKVDKAVRDTYRETIAESFIDLVYPEGIKLRFDGEGNYTLVADREFKKGDTIFENDSEILDIQDLNNVTLCVPMEYTENFNPLGQEQQILIPLDVKNHTISHKGGKLREFYGFDTFGNHSCDPNGIHELQLQKQTEYAAGDRIPYKLIASRSIRKGEEITCDYRDIIDGTSLDNFEFQCQCGSKNCQGTILN